MESKNAPIAAAVTVTVMTDLSADSFKDCASVRDLYIASPMTSVADSAFRGMNLRSITLPASVTSLGAYAFADCKSLTEINGIDSVTVMGEGAFQNVNQLTSIDLSRVKTIGDPLLTRVERIADRRPHVLDAEPDKDRKGDRLPDKRNVDIHG